MMDIVEYSEEFDSCLAEALAEGENIDFMRATFQLEMICPMELRMKAAFVGMELNFEAVDSAAIFAEFHYYQAVKGASVLKRLFSAQVCKELKNLQIIHQYSLVTFQNITLDRQKLYINKLVNDAIKLHSS
jgi:hypothetical protein